MYHEKPYLYQKLVSRFSQKTFSTEYLKHPTLPVQYEAKYFFVWKLVSRASPPHGLFFKISLLLSYRSISLRKVYEFLGAFPLIELFIRFFRLKGRLRKKGPRGGLALETNFQTKKRNSIYNEGLLRFFEEEMTYFRPVFCSFLRQMSMCRAETFTTASPLQPQHML